MSSQESKQLVMRGYELFAKKDIQGLIALCTEDIEWCGPESELISFSGTFSGRSELADFFAKLDQEQEARRFEPQEYIAEGDKVVVVGQGTWTVKSTGNTYDSPWVHIFDIRDGKIARFRHYDDTAAAEHAYMPAYGTLQQRRDSTLRP